MIKSDVSYMQLYLKSLKGVLQTSEIQPRDLRFNFLQCARQEMND